MPDDLITSGATGGVAGLIVAFLKDAYEQYKSDKKDETLQKRLRNIEGHMTSIKLDLAKNYASNDDIQRIQESLRLDHKAILERVDTVQTLCAEIRGYISERIKH